MNQLKERLIHYFHSLLKSPILKIVGVETAILARVWTGIRAEVFLVLLLSAVDLISGVGVSIKYRKVSSWGLRQTILKLAIYLTLIFLGGFIKIVTGFDWADSAFVGLIVATEMISIVENFQLICPGVLPKSLLQHFGIDQKRKRK